MEFNNFVLKFFCRGHKASHLQLQRYFSLWGSCLKAGSEGSQLHRCLVESGGEGSPVQDAPASPFARPTVRQLQSWGQAGENQQLSLGEIILSLNEFELPEIEAVQVSHTGVQGSAVDPSKPQAHRLLLQELHTVTSSSLYIQERRVLAFNNS